MEEKSQLFLTEELPIIDADSLLSPVECALDLVTCLQPSKHILARLTSPVISYVDSSYP